MDIRPLQQGEERLWVACGAPADEVEARLAQFMQRRVDLAEDPLCFIVALEGGHLKGKLRATMPHPQFYLINAVTVPEEAEFDHIAAALMDFALDRQQAGRVEAVNWDNPQEDCSDSLYRQYGFKVYIEKALVRRDLGDFRNPYANPFTFRNYADVGREAFVHALAGIHSQNPNRDAGTADPAADLEESLQEAGPAFNAATWQLAYLAGELAGLLLPQIFPDARAEGTLLNIGLLPAFRGRGLGKVLHAHGLATLQAAGASKYVGSTDTLNEPMLRVFAANQCPTIGVRRLYRRS